MDYRIVRPSLAAFLEPLAHRWNVASLSLFYRYYLVDVHLIWLIWFHFLIIKRGVLVILIDWMIFLSPFLDVTEIYVNSFFPCTARLCNSPPIEYFLLTFDLNGLKSRTLADFFLSWMNYLHYWMLVVIWTVYYEITLVCLSICPTFRHWVFSRLDH